MSLTIDLPPAVEAKLRDAALRERKSLEEYVCAVLQEHLLAVPNIHGGLSAMLDEWLAAPVDPEEVEGYPEYIEPLRLREGFVSYVDTLPGRPRKFRHRQRGRGRRQ
jgi:hypothetical protein